MIVNKIIFFFIYRNNFKKFGNRKLKLNLLPFQKILDIYLNESAPPFNNPRGLLKKNEIETEVNSRMKNEMNFNLA